MTENDQGRKLTLSEAHAYWKSPAHECNDPLAYLADSETHRLSNASLLSVFHRHVEKTDSILEIGCNAGRNLHTLWADGYRNLSAVEISQPAIDVMRQHLPNVYTDSKITVGAIEDVIKTIPKTRHDVIFTMAVLVHLSDDSLWVMKEIAKKAKKKIIVFEFEAMDIQSDRHFPRKYKPLFQSHKRPEIEKVWPVPGLPKSYVCRVFGPTPV